MKVKWWHLTMQWRPPCLSLWKQSITSIDLQIWQKEGASLEARCQQAGTHLVGLNYIYSNQISFARLNPDESHDYCNRQSEFTEDPKSDLFSIIDKMEQFRKSLKRDHRIRAEGRRWALAEWRLRPLWQIQTFFSSKKFGGKLLSKLPSNFSELVRGCPV